MCLFTTPNYVDHFSESGLYQIELSQVEQVLANMLQ